MDQTIDSQSQSIGSDPIMNHVTEKLAPAQPDTTATITADARAPFKPSQVKSTALMAATLLALATTSRR